MKKKFLHNNTSRPPRCPRLPARSSGFTIIEMLIALSITALLLTATGIAFEAALQNYQANQTMHLLGTGARNALHQLSVQLRSCHNNPTDGWPTTVNTDGSEITFVNQAGQTVTYHYNDTDNTIEISLDGSAYQTVLQSVFPFASDDPVFTAHPAPQALNLPVGTIGCIDIRFRLTNGSSSQAVSTSVVPCNVAFAR